MECLLKYGQVLEQKVVSGLNQQVNEPAPKRHESSPLKTYWPVKYLSSCLFLSAKVFHSLTRLGLHLNALGWSTSILKRIYYCFVAIATVEQEKEMGIFKSVVKMFSFITQGLRSEGRNKISKWKPINQTQGEQNCNRG